MLIEVPEDLNSLEVLREIINEEYSMKYKSSCRFFNQKGNEITEDTIILLNDNEVIYVEPSLKRSFDFNTILSQYQIIDKLGQGGFGKVLKAQNRQSKELVAIKYIDITEYSTLIRNYLSLLREQSRRDI
jgi:MAP/microtubule affinity-regulating kinase